MVQIEVPPEFAYSIFVAIFSVFVLFWKGFQVTGVRKSDGVKYPNMYSPENKGDNKFNRYQRAHQNTLENYTQILMLMFVGAVSHPVLSAGAGLFYFISRIVYALGYYRGVKGRVPGAVGGFLAQIALAYCAVKTGLMVFYQ